MTEAMNSFVGQNGGVVRPPAPARKHTKHEDEEAGKLFVGGLSWETSQDSLLRYFSRFGEVIDCVVMKNAETGRSRGFGFVTFSDPNNMDKVIQSCPHVLDGRTIDPKPCNPRSMQQKPKRNTNWPKVFLGGLPSSITETDLRAFFGRYGEVVEVVIMYDQEKKKARGFGFLSFLTDDAVDRAVVDHYVTIQNKQVEIKRAEPRNTMMNELLAAATASNNGPVMDQWGAVPPVVPHSNGIHATVTATYSGWGAPPATAVAQQQQTAAAAVPISHGFSQPAAFNVAAAPLVNHHHWGGTPPPPHNNNTQPSPSHHHTGWSVALQPGSAPPPPTNGSGGAAYAVASAGQQPLQYAATPQHHHHPFVPPPLSHTNGPVGAAANPPPPPGHHHHHTFTTSYWGSPPGLTPPPPSTPGDIYLPTAAAVAGGGTLHSSPPQHKYEVTLAAGGGGGPPPFPLHPSADYGRLYAVASAAAPKPPAPMGGTTTQYHGGPTSPEYFTAAPHPHHHHHHYVVSEPSRVVVQQQQQQPPTAVATYGGQPVVTTYLSYRRT